MPTMDISDPMSDGPVFHLFPRLPSEMQLEIWKQFNEPVPRDIQITITQPGFNGTFFKKPQLKSLTKVPAILHVCHDSRKIGLQTYKKVIKTQGINGEGSEEIYVNPKIDTILLHKPDWVEQEKFSDWMYFGHVGAAGPAGNVGNGMLTSTPVISGSTHQIMRCTVILQKETYSPTPSPYPQYHPVRPSYLATIPPWSASDPNSGPKPPPLPSTIFIILPITLPLSSSRQRLRIRPIIGNGTHLPSPAFVQKGEKALDAIQRIGLKAEKVLLGAWEFPDWNSFWDGIFEELERKGWDSEWESAVRRQPEGWVAHAAMKTERERERGALVMPRIHEKVNANVSARRGVRGVGGKEGMEMS